MITRGSPLTLIEKMQVLDAVLRDGRFKLNATDTKTLFTLIRRQNPRTGQCNPSMSTLASDQNVSKRSVLSSIKKLKALDLIRAERGVRGTSNSYSLDHL